MSAPELVSVDEAQAKRLAEMEEQVARLIRLSETEAAATRANAADNDARIAALKAERDGARADFETSEALMVPLVRAWEAADEDSRSLAELHVPGIRAAIEEIRDGREGRWWEVP